MFVSYCSIVYKLFLYKSEIYFYNPFKVFIFEKTIKPRIMKNNSRYLDLRLNPPKLIVLGNPRRVVMKMVSAMCDNRSEIIFTKMDNGEYSMVARNHSGMGESHSNYQTGFSKIDILWEAEDNKWSKVIEMINGGTAVIEDIKSK